MKLISLAIFIVIFLSCQRLFAQQKGEIDSLALFILNTTDRELKLASLNQLTFLLRERDLDKALGYGLSAESLALELQDSVALIRAKGNIGWIHYRKGNWNQAFRYSKDAYLLSNLIHENQELPNVLNNLGALYYQKTNYSQAIKFFTQALKLADDNKDTYAAIRSLNNIALNYSKLNEADSAIYFAEEALKRNEEAGSVYFKSFTMRVIGDVLLAKGQYEEAIKIYLQSLAQVSHQRLNSFESSIMHRLGKAYLEIGDYVAAKACLEKGKQQAEQGGFKPELAETYLHLYLLYDQTARNDLAFENLKKFTELKLKLDEENDKNKLRLFQEMFDVDKADAELAALKAEAATQTLELQFSRRFNFMGILVAFILTAFVLWMFFLNRKKNKLYQQLLQESNLVKQQKIQLEKKSIELEESNAAKNKLISILSHDLKSPIHQLKSVLQLMAEEELSAIEMEMIQKRLLQNVDELYTNVENLLIWSVSQMEGFKLKSELVNLKGAVFASMGFIRSVADAKNVYVEIDVSELHTIQGDADILSLIIRNALSNAIKFSTQNSVVKLVSSRLDDCIRLSVKDTGLGMPPSKVQELLSVGKSLSQSSKGTSKEKGTGLGFGLMSEFTQRMGGKIQVFSQVNLGTEIVFLFPR